MDFFLFLNFNVPNSRQPLFSSLYTNDSKKKSYFYRNFFCTAACLMRGKGKVIHFLTIT